MRRAAPGRRHGRWGPAGAWGRGGGSPGRPPSTRPQRCEVCVCVWGGGGGRGRARAAGLPEYTGSRPGLQAGGRLKDADLGAEASGAAVEGFLNVKAEVWDGGAGWRTLQTVSRIQVSRAFSGYWGREGREGVLKLRCN